MVEIWDHATGHVNAEADDDTKKDELQGYLAECVIPSATVYSDHAASYEDLKQPHEAVEHGIGEYVHDLFEPNSRIRTASSRSGQY